MKMIVGVGENRVTLRVLRQGAELIVTLDDGRTVRATLQAEGTGQFTFLHDGVRHHGAVTTVGRARQLWLDGRLITYYREQPGAPREHAAVDATMASPIPAVVRELLVAVGDPVVSGQKLLLLESMKMVLPIQATRDGRVRAILCAPGDAVSPGVPLAEIEDA
jgi:acetyl-CoA carboxylase biotin carboxyl carrier protein